MSDTLPVHVTVVIPTRNEEAAIVDTIRSVPNDGWCEKLDFLIVDGNSTDRTCELAEQEGATVYREPRKGYGRAYKTGFVLAPGEIIITMDADCTYPGEEVPNLVKKLLDEDLQWITCDRLRRAEEGAMPGIHGFGNWVLSTTATKDVVIKWYYDGSLNVSYNCIDRHALNTPDKVAIIWEGDKPVKKTSRKTLKLLGTVGEPINPEAWQWYYKTVGDSRCPIVDT
ncbi:MAG TPA: glycosyltransferase, partial [Candidatus Thalassarchaeaceae archaeon]|nr:glycosyltransferase [Candidatus Thalassarchaeaceae archaeon]